jgi:hypothetical protein
VFRRSIAAGREKLAISPYGSGMTVVDRTTISVRFLGAPPLDESVGGFVPTFGLQKLG